MSARYWCFTINNPTGNSNDEFEHPDIVYVVGGYEYGESGTRHIQGFVEFRNRKRLAGAKKVFRTAHLEIKRGTIEQAIAYCKKDGDWFEHGVRPVEQHVKGAEAQKAKWAKILQSSMDGDFKSIRDEHPDEYVRYYHSLKRIHKDEMRKPDDLQDVCGEWYYGEAGSGKTTKARTENPTAYIKSRDQWWDGYRDEPTVILDDIDKFNVKLGAYLKDWGDRWTFKAEEKGGYKWIRPSKFIVTSQYSIDAIWDDKETREALHRRFKVLHFNRRLGHYVPSSPGMDIDDNVIFNGYN